MGRISYREYLAWLAWIDAQWDQPSLTDYHLMRVAQRVQQVLAKNPGQISLEHQQVKFERKKAEAPPMTAAQRKAHIERSKAMWCTAVGLKRK